MMIHGQPHGVTLMPQNLLRQALQPAEVGICGMAAGQNAFNTIGQIPYACLRFQ